jgi:hypothetical protein
MSGGREAASDQDSGTANASPQNPLGTGQPSAVPVVPSLPILGTEGGAEVGMLRQCLLN